MDTMILNKTKNGLTTQTIRVDKKTEFKDIKNAINSIITLEFFVDFGNNFIIEFDNVTLSATDILRAIKTIRKMPVPCRRLIPRIIETSDQIDAIVNTQFVYNTYRS